MEVICDLHRAVLVDWRNASPIRAGPEREFAESELAEFHAESESSLASCHLGLKQHWVSLWALAPCLSMEHRPRPCDWTKVASLCYRPIIPSLFLSSSGTCSVSGCPFRKHLPVEGLLPFNSNQPMQIGPWNQLTIYAQACTTCTEIKKFLLVLWPSGFFAQKPPSWWKITSGYRQCLGACAGFTLAFTTFPSSS